MLAKKVANALEELLGGAIVRDLALVRGISEDGEAVDGVEVVLVPALSRSRFEPLQKQSGSPITIE